ncbi:hypothetical protein FOS14_11920 [Skermania sp. ID1734]|uniref:hypothetical protein n=1 Tax=Skermania sp. ID1734 TaxID=2597516 RepID=UPI00117EB900|nr:hypothetical protein [Skermania sp. ID1734]TSD99485.1 hypothetical protein FOS14_11920 [Skermania sp. ID1734]
MRALSTILPTGTVVCVGALAVTAGCSTGPDTHPSGQDSIVTGAGATVGTIELRNVLVVPATAEDCTIQRDGPAHLRFTAVNESKTENDRLVAISTAAGSSVRIDASPQTLVIEPGTAVAAGQPIEQPADSPAPDDPFSVTIEHLADTVRPGLPMPVTFTFEHAGKATVRAPLDSCQQQSR